MDSETPGMMRVPVFVGDGRLEIMERPMPKITKSDDVLIAVEACGLCGTDLNILAVPPAHKAAPGTVLGHEFVGTVSETGDGVRHLKAGDRVVVAPRLVCGLCRYCRRGLFNQCEDYRTLGIHLDGGLAPFCIAPERASFRIRRDVPLDDAVFAEVLSCVLDGTTRVPIQPGESVAILGAGPAGLLFAKMYRASGAGTIIMADIAPFRLQFAAQHGADILINTVEQDAEMAVRQATELGADVVVDAVGSLMPLAIKLARRGGRVILFGLQQHAIQSLSQYFITRHTLTLYGAFVGVNTFPLVVQMLESRKVRPSELITHRLPALDVAQGLDAMRAGTTMKVIVEHPHSKGIDK
jgi:threonine dehydrogenase-like Zn-dependent dehydrogenase